MMHVSVEDTTAESRPNVSSTASQCGRMPTTYIRVLLPASSSAPTFMRTHMPIRVMTTESASRISPARSALFFAVLSSFDKKFLDMMSGPRK